MTIRELLFNTAQRRRSDQSLTAVSEALGWPVRREVLEETNVIVEPVG
jgi:hypothetical protein